MLRLKLSTARRSVSGRSSRSTAEFKDFRKANRDLRLRRDTSEKDNKIRDIDKTPQRKISYATFYTNNLASNSKIKDLISKPVGHFRRALSLPLFKGITKRFCDSFTP